MDIQQPMALLYGDLDLHSGQVVDQLARRHIQYRIAGNGSRMLVPAEQVAEARLNLAREKPEQMIGYEIFDRPANWRTASSGQNVNSVRALEGELARTIRTIQGVRAARVHLVLPRREPFARERQEAQASVMLTMAGAARARPGRHQAILNLVAAAVPGLRPQNIAMVDSRGNLLARAGQPTGPADCRASGEELQRATELRSLAPSRRCWSTVSAPAACAPKPRST